MKSLKQITAVLLMLCLMIGMPFAVSAVGTATPDEFKLLYAMEMPDWMAKNEVDKGRTILLYFNSMPKDPGTTLYFELLGFASDAPTSLTDVTPKSSRTLTLNTDYGTWGTSNMIAITFDAQLDGDYSNESTFNNVLANANCDPNRWYIAITQPQEQEGQTYNNGLIDGWTNTLNQTMATNGRRRAVVSGDTTQRPKGDTLFFPFTKQEDLLTFDSAVMTDDTHFTFSFSEPVYLDHRYSKEATLRIVDSAYNVVKYDPSNTEAPYSTDAGTDLEVVLTFDSYISTGNDLHGSFSNPSNGKISNIAIQDHLANANAQDGEGSYRLCAAISEGGFKADLGEGMGNLFVDTLWSYDADADNHTYKPLVAHNSDANRDRAWCEVTIESFEACIGEQKYTTLSQAVAAAAAGQTITLLDNVTVDAWKDTVGITLDLNGNTLSAETVSAIAPSSKIIDSSDGQGGIQIAKNNDTAKSLQISANSNEYLPLYDASMNDNAGGYRFFKCTLEHMGKENGTQYWYGYRMNMSNAAFALLVDDDDDGDNKIDADIQLDYNIKIKVDDVEKDTLNRYFKASILTEYGTMEQEDATKLNYAATLKVTGFEKITDQKVTITSFDPQIVSSTGVVIAATATSLDYTYSNNA